MAIDIREFFALADEHKKKSIESLSSATKTVRAISELEDLTREMKHIINKSFNAPNYLSTLEKVVFYFNRKQNLTLQEIADECGYTLTRMKQISQKVNQKLNKHNYN